MRVLASNDQGGLGVWTVIFVAPSEKLADRICARLSEEGFLAKSRQTGTAREQYEILVPASELDDVKDLLNDIVHSSYQ
jgi:ribosomal protein S8